MTMTIKFYNNFFEWYQEESKRWERKYPNCLYGPGISDELFIYFIEKYLYNGDKYALDYIKLKYILRKYSARYRKEIFYLKFFNKIYKDKNYADKQTISEFCIENYSTLPVDIYVRFCKDYLIEPYICPDPIGHDQINLDILYDILKKHSLKFRFENYLYKLFGKKYN